MSIQDPKHTRKEGEWMSIFNIAGVGKVVVKYFLFSSLEYNGCLLRMLIDLPAAPYYFVQVQNTSRLAIKIRFPGHLYSESNHSHNNEVQIAWFNAYHNDIDGVPYFESLLSSYFESKELASKGIKEIDRQLKDKLPRFFKANPYETLVPIKGINLDSENSMYTRVDLLHSRDKRFLVYMFYLPADEDTNFYKSKKGLESIEEKLTDVAYDDFKLIPYFTQKLDDGVVYRVVAHVEELEKSINDINKLKQELSNNVDELLKEAQEKYAYIKQQYQQESGDQIFFNIAYGKSVFTLSAEETYTYDELRDRWKGSIRDLCIPADIAKQTNFLDKVKKYTDARGLPSWRVVSALDFKLEFIVDDCKSINEARLKVVDGMRILKETIEKENLQREDER